MANTPRRFGVLLVLLALTVLTVTVAQAQTFFFPQGSIPAGSSAPAGPVNKSSWWFDTNLGYLLGHDGTGWQSDAALSMKEINALDPEWGITGAGVVDDAAKINSLITSKATTNRLYFPCGTYLVNSASITATTRWYMRGAGPCTVFKNTAGASTPTFLLNGVQYFDFRDFAVIGLAANPNDAFMTQANGGTRTAFGVFRHLILNPNGNGIHLTAANTILIDDIAWWPSSSSWLGATASANSRLHAIYADGTAAVNDIHMRFINAEAITTIANGGTGTIYWKTTTSPSINITIENGELEDGSGNGAAAIRAISLQNIVGGLYVRGNFTENADIQVLNSVDGSIQAWAAATGTITIGDGTAPNANSNIVVYDTRASTYTADANNDHVGAVNSRFDNGYTNNATSPLTLNVKTTGAVAAIDQLPHGNVSINGILYFNRQTSGITGPQMAFAANTMTWAGGTSGYQWLNQAGTTGLMTLGNTGGLQLGSPTGGDPGANKVNIAAADGYLVNNVALKNITETLSNKTLAAPIIGSGGTAITLTKVYAPSLTPSQLAAAIGVTEQTFTVTGLTTADKVIVNGPAPTALCPPVTYRVSAADTLAIGFVDLTAALCTPAAGTYNIVAIRS